ncbi:QRFP-like peptide receptor [Mytilus edulis]|uniref:QRFP-like peptide receptor n=1 Tax=Mytilus edulis TaxID=6550 RepID=UPI0039EF804C
MDQGTLFKLLDKNVSGMNETTILELYRSLQIFDTYFQEESIVLTALYVPVFLLGFLGNFIVIILVLTNQQLRNSTNLYLCNMAAADLFVSLICVPMAVGHALYRVWIYGEFMCKVTAYLQGVTVAASIFTISTLSVDRFLAIRHPMIFRRVSNTRAATRIIIVIWIVSIVIMAPLLIVKKVNTLHLFEEPIHFCHEIWPHITHRQAYDICLFLFVYVIPGIVIFIAYSLIGNKLWTEDKNLQRTESETSKGIGRHVMSGRKRVAKMLIALAVLFAVCWLPYYVVSLYLDFTTEGVKNFLLVLPFTILLGHSNSAFNPILYFYSSQSFRKYLYRALKCRSNRTKRSLAVRYTPAQNNKHQDANVKPRIRISSTGSFKSSGTGSFRFSRSSNTSLKSSNLSSRSRESRSDKKRESDKDTLMIERKSYTLPLVIMHGNGGKKLLKAHKKEILDTSLSIPSTINEESSRLGSISPVNVVTTFKADIMPEIEEAPEDIQLYLSVSKTELSLKYIDSEEEIDNV